MKGIITPNQYLCKNISLQKLHSSWVKNTSTARWQSPLGDPPALTAEQQSQNDAETHSWHYVWNESAYQADNTTGWDLTNALA